MRVISTRTHLSPHLLFKAVCNVFAVHYKQLHKCIMRSRIRFLNYLTTFFSIHCTTAIASTPDEAFRFSTSVSKKANLENNFTTFGFELQTESYSSLCNQHCESCYVEDC